MRALLQRLLRFVSGTVFGKLIRVFAVVLTLAAATQYLVACYFWMRYAAETGQRSYQDLAANLVVALRAEQAADPDFDLLHAMARWSVVNPTLDFYALNNDGSIRESTAAERGRALNAVPVQPIEESLRGLAPGRAPLYGIDPSLPPSRTVFSAARLPDTLGGGYLYVVLQKGPHLIGWGPVGQRHLLLGSVAAMILIVGASVALGALFFRIVTRDLRVLAEAARKIEQGDFQQCVPENPNDEFGQVGRAFNLMSAKIAAQIAKLKDVDERRRSFVANVAHDLRTPLTALRGLHEVIAEKNVVLPPDIERLLGAARENVQFQTRLVDDLFELSKLEAKHRAPKPEMFSLAPVLEFLELTFEPKFQAAEVLFQVEAAPNPIVYADRVMIEQVLANLIDNAVQYSRAGGRITVRAAREAQLMRIEVEDTGVGIAADKLPFVFDRFYRVESPELRRKKGTGLGLAIAKLIIEAHGQRIEVESTPGKGTTFRFGLECGVEPAL